MQNYRGRTREQKIQTLKILVAIILIVIIASVLTTLHEAKNEAAAVVWQARWQEPVARTVVTPEPTPEPTLEPTPEPTPTPRLTLTADEVDLIARIVWHEARGESLEGQRAVVEVIFNRIEADNFPDTVEDVIYQKNQFASAGYVDSAEPTTEQFEAINEALYEEPMLPGDVVYFSRGAENDRVWGVIGGHTFCRQYEW
jgi:hypothetical protein